WPGSPGGSTGSRWPGRPRCWAGWRCTCGSPAFRSTPTWTPRATATRAVPCHPASSGACGALAGYFISDWQPAQIISVALQAVPALIGAFVGAPVLAREMETGTFRYAWTQGFGRWRWTVAKLVPLGIVVAAAAGAFSLLFSWYYQPFFSQ